ncbi:RNA polymerase sigma factor [Plantactinospora siamensis]|uniref:RNA polymerase sigma factor n=1 Tax=Plantactinospora siamensis TaxID=555372 RepID=A0ABV6NRH8_9ACTN
MSGVGGAAARIPGPVDGTTAREAEAACRKAEHDREFEAFTEGTYHIVERILRAACPDQAMVEDALNEAYLHGRVRWPKIRGYDAPIGWIITTARNKLRKERQRRQREAAVAPEDLPPATHSDIADAWEARATLEAWLHQLPSRHAEVFQLSRAGFTNQEIARLLSLADNSVRSYKMAAKRRLRELAEEAGYTDSEVRRQQGGTRGSR